MNVQDIEQKLGKHADLVTIEQATDCVIVKPRAYIHDKEKWNTINKLLKEEGSKWVPMPQGIGHWEVPLLKPVFKQDEDMFIAAPTHGTLILDFETLLKQGYKKLTVKWEK